MLTFSEATHSNIAAPNRYTPQQPAGEREREGGRVTAPHNTSPYSFSHHTHMHGGANDAALRGADERAAPWIFGGCALTRASRRARASLDHLTRANLVLETLLRGRGQDEDESDYYIRREERRARALLDTAVREGPARCCDERDGSPRVLV